MPSYLNRLIEYNNWANQGLLEFLGAMPPETLDTTAAGVYGSIRETLEHLFSSELSYHRRLAARPLVDLAERPGHPDLAVLRQLAGESAANLVDLVDSLPEPGAMIQLSDGKRAAATILTQLFMHGCEHRAQVGTILGARGIEPPDLDSWAHGIFVHGDDWPNEWGPEPADR
jgi:uncharacterized damage-inducible protein DinB